MVDPDAMGSCNPEEQLSRTEDLDVISHGAHQPSACRNCTSILYSLYVSENVSIHPSMLRSVQVNYIHYLMDP